MLPNVAERVNDSRSRSLVATFHGSVGEDDVEQLGGDRVGVESERLPTMATAARWRGRRARSTRSRCSCPFLALPPGGRQRRCATVAVEQRGEDPPGMGSARVADRLIANQQVRLAIVKVFARLKRMRLLALRCQQVPTLIVSVVRRLARVGPPRRMPAACRVCV